MLVPLNTTFHALKLQLFCVPAFHVSCNLEMAGATLETDKETGAVAALYVVTDGVTENFEFAAATVQASWILNAYATPEAKPRAVHMIWL